MEQAIFQFARLEGVDFEHAHLDCADLRGAYLGQLELTEYLTNPEIRHQIFGDSNSVESTENRLDKVIGRIRNEYVTNEIKFITEMDGREMEGLDFKGVEIKTILVEASLQYAHLEGANLSNAQLTHANLSHAYLGKYKDRFYPDPHATYNNDLHRGNCSPAWPGVTGTRQRVTVRQPKSGCVKGRDMSQQIHDSRRPVPADL